MTQSLAQGSLAARRRFGVLASLAILASFAGPTASTASMAAEPGAEPNTQVRNTIVDIAARDGRFTTLVAALQAAGLDATLASDGPFTVFAPTDEAFSRLPHGTVERLLVPGNRDELVALLTFHVVAGRIGSRDLLGAGSASTVNGKRLLIGLRVANAAVTQTDIHASNGIIHVVDEVLRPRPMSSPQANAANLIRKAIERGAPLYNAGQVMACVSVYEVAAEALLQGYDSMPDTARRALRRGLDRMASTHGASDKAWVMREALDEAYASLVPERRMMTTVGDRR